MLVNIGKVKIGKRIRKEYGDITSLANDIREQGLINPPVVTPDYELIAGERRLRALKKLDYKQIEVRVMSVENYEHQLKIEISENEERKEFTYSERMDYAKQLERIEAKKAKDRQLQGKNLEDRGPQGRKEQTRDVVGKAAGFGSGRQYSRAKYIYENADEETIKEVDEGKKTVRKAHDELRERLKQKEATITELKTDSELTSIKKKKEEKQIEKPKTQSNDIRVQMNEYADSVTDEERKVINCEMSAINIVEKCKNLLYTIDGIEDLELTLRFLSTQETESLKNVIKVSKALSKIIEKGELQNV
ncbi:ParB N-terminal domain-containing protein [Mammaliicoccus sciuri]|uniref:ParB N-terminal domain-containing protein n=1 Tax=Mammaliicoccus sciuri TaxID=1296 RepID=UPI003CE72845